MAELFLVLFFYSIPILLWVLGLVDCVKSEFSGNNKIAWVLIIIFLPVLGAILYFAVGRSQKLN